MSFFNKISSVALVFETFEKALGTKIYIAEDVNQLKCSEGRKNFAVVVATTIFLTPHCSEIRF